MENRLSDEKFRLAAAAKTLGVSVFALRRWVRLGRIPHYRCGRALVFSGADLEEFLSRCRVSSRGNGADPAA